MRNIINGILLGMILMAAAADAQSAEPRKCRTFDFVRQGIQPGISAKLMTVTRPNLQKSILSPSKRFRIHFDTTGINTPAMVTSLGQRINGTAAAYVDTVAKIFDSVWTAEVTTYGFPAPPSDNNEGGGNEYDVYLEDLGANTFAQTDWDSNSPLPGSFAAPRYTSYMEVDNDFGTGFRTIGIHALMSTAAHEFLHAIQVGNYGVWYDDLYFYELSAESMEPIVFPVSKDYVNDIKTYFGNIHNISLYTPFTTYSGYERAIWGDFLMKRYGVSIMKQIWDAMAEQKPIPAMKMALEKRGTTLEKEFSEFCYWNYFTGPRADSVLYYPDAKLFPTVDIRDQEVLGTTSILFQYSCKGFTANYLQTTKGIDTVSYIIANTNMSDALGSQSGSFPYQLTVSSSSANGGTQVANGVFANFLVTDGTNWKYLPISQQGPVPPGDPVCFPNPFRPAASPLFISLNTDQMLQPAQTLNVYSSGYDLVFTGTLTEKESLNGIRYVKWSGKSNRGEDLASGIYLYVLTSGGSTTKGKFAVIR